MVILVKNTWFSIENIQHFSFKPYENIKYILTVAITHQYISNDLDKMKLNTFDLFCSSFIILIALCQMNNNYVTTDF